MSHTINNSVDVYKADTTLYYHTVIHSTKALIIVARAFILVSGMFLAAFYCNKTLFLISHSFFFD